MAIRVPKRVVLRDFASVRERKIEQISRSIFQYRPVLLDPQRGSTLHSGYLFRHLRLPFWTPDRYSKMKNEIETSVSYIGRFGIYRCGFVYIGKFVYIQILKHFQLRFAKVSKHIYFMKSKISERNSNRMLFV